MFTGLIETTGQIRSVTPLGDGISVWIDVNSIFSDIALGESISVNGVCSTVVDFDECSFKVDYLKETLSKTTFFTCSVDQIVNLERSLTSTSRLGGHMVSGHVDCTGRLISKDVSGPWTVITIEYPSHFYPFLIPKGSITIDGISLTVVDVSMTTFTCHIIPHTLSETTLPTLNEGDAVNLEYDQMGKYIVKFMALSDSHRTVVIDKLKQLGGFL